MNKLVAEHLPQIRMDSLKRQGFLSDEYWQADYKRGSNDPMQMLPQNSNEFRYLLKVFGHRKFVEVSWIIDDQRQYQEVKLVNSNMNFGNCRYWFLCSRCSRRCTVLYIFQYLLGCNSCLNVAYESQNRTKRAELTHDEVDETNRVLTELWLTLWKKNRFFYDNRPTKEYLHYLISAREQWVLSLGDPTRSAVMYQAHDPLLFKPPHLALPH
jgi:hypothetical protein